MPAAYDRCVNKVKAKGKTSNPFAVCRASMGSDKEIKARARQPKSKRK